MKQVKKKAGSEERNARSMGGDRMRPSAARTLHQSPDNREGSGCRGRAFSDVRTAKVLYLEPAENVRAATAEPQSQQHQSLPAILFMKH